MWEYKKQVAYFEITYALLLIMDLLSWHRLGQLTNQKYHSKPVSFYYHSVRHLSAAANDFTHKISGLASYIATIEATEVAKNM